LSLDTAGIFITKWGSYGIGDGQFNAPVGVAVDGCGQVYVADLENNHRIKVFEGYFVDSDCDGIPDDEDACPLSDLSETVVIDGCDSGVENVLLEDGCTISDLILECAGNAKNHGKFVSSVSHMSNYLKKKGTISGKEKGKIQKCAAKANIP
jgi:hypothetical protein